MPLVPKRAVIAHYQSREKVLLLGNRQPREPLADFRRSGLYIDERRAGLFGQPRRITAGGEQDANVPMIKAVVLALTPGGRA